MEILARTVNQKGEHKVLVSTAARARTHSRRHPGPRATGSRGNGGELLFLALATCYSKDLHREANQRGIRAESVEVRVSGEFGAEGRKRRETFAIPPRFRPARQTRKFYAPR
jgi:uncharacterized OsmC-like protein